MKSLFILILGFGVLYPAACSKSTKKPSSMKPQKYNQLALKSIYINPLV